jgi:hypothetical protein
VVVQASSTRGAYVDDGAAPRPPPIAVDDGRFFAQGMVVDSIDDLR